MEVAFAFSGAGVLFLMATPALGLVRQARTSPHRLLDHPLRARILAVVRRDPGLLFARLRTLAACSAGTLQHHLHMLAQADLVESERDRRRHHVFPRGMDPQLRRWLSTFARHRHAQDVLRAAARDGGISPRQAAQELQLGRKSLRACIRELEGSGLLRPQQPTKARLQATPLGHGLLRKLEDADPAAPPRLL